MMVTGVAIVLYVQVSSFEHTFCLWLYGLVYNSFCVITSLLMAIMFALTLSNTV